ncbi:MAG: hypothetical protein GF344_20505 [Chitinivibrionales bacterium]|nr:hypothetical protein [Chitinivibrionales bacterium]
MARYLWDTDQAFGVYRSINGNDTICHLYNPSERERGQGRCALYPWRGFLCRWFGFVAAKDEVVRRRLMTCRRIRSRYEETIAALDGRFLGAALPRWPETKTAFEKIEPTLARRSMHINKALKGAIEVVFEAGYSPPAPRTAPRAA